MELVVVHYPFSKNRLHLRCSKKDFKQEYQPHSGELLVEEA